MANTAVSSQIGFVGWEAESSFAESGDDTYTVVHQVRDDELDLSGLVRPMLDPAGTYQRLNERDLARVGGYGVSSFSFTLDLAAHGATTASGALTETNLAKLLAHVVGNSAWTQQGGVSSGGGDADTLVTDGGSEAFVLGSLLRVGALGDARGGGQAVACSTVTGSPATSTELLTGTAAGAADGDVVYAMGMVYPVSASGSGDIITADDSTSSNTLRFVVSTGNTAWVLRGCACTGITINGLNPGEIPSVTFEWGVAAFAPITVTFPSATAIADKVPTVNANGSCFIQTAGTTTSATVAPLEMSISIGQGMVPVMGPGGATVGQNVVGWRRVPAETTMNLVIEAEAQTASPAYWLTANRTTARHILVTGNTVDGASWAFYAPRADQMNDPTQGSTNGLNTYSLDFKLLTNTTTTSELTLSAWRLGLG